MSLLKRALAIEDEMIALRRKIHANPETAFQEFRTTELIENQLQVYGIETKRIEGLTGIIGILHGKIPGGKVIGLRADIDALKLQEETGLSFASKNDGICHACGHDIHIATVLACARMLSELKAELAGTVKFIFQPAEEGQGGARAMIQNGVLNDPKVDAIIASHCWPEMPAGCIGVRKGVMLAASDKFKITVLGKGGHAAHPQKCIDPVVVIAHIITQLQTIISRELDPLDSAVISIGHLHAGSALNIIPSEAVLEGTIRTFNKETRKAVQESIKRIALLTAESLNATAMVDYTTGAPPTISDDVLVDAISASVKEFLGEDKLLQVMTPSMGAEDFAEYLEYVPGALFRLGTADERPASRLALHGSQTLFSEKAIVAGAVTMCGVVFSLTNSNNKKLL